MHKELFDSEDNEYQSDGLRRFYCVTLAKPIRYFQKGHCFAAAEIDYDRGTIMFFAYRDQPPTMTLRVGFKVI